MKRLTVSPNRRFLIFDDGTPFFWLGDTAWELFHRLTLEEAEFYLEHRRQQGFTVIQAVVLAELDGLHAPNAYGECPLFGDDPLRPNERYFAHVDRVLRLAEAKGLWVGLLPSWGDKVELLAHGVGPVVFNPDRARGYGAWIGRRYHDFANLVWINGGDRSGGGLNGPVWQALAEGIKSADPHHLMTFHPLGGGGGHSSSEWFHGADWLDFNLAQSGHESRGLPNYQILERDYALAPTKPCLDGEPRYEDHAVNWKPAELGYFDDYDIRQAAYWAVLSGALGHTYGCHPIWQFYAPGREPVGFARRPWREALDLPGACQMGHLRALMESRPMLERVPDPSVLADPGVGGEVRRAARGKDHLLVYLPVGGTVNLQLASSGSLAGEASVRQWRPWWFDPRTGAVSPLGLIDAAARLRFTAPAAGRGQDWVLVLDAAQTDYPPPGASWT